MRPLILRDRPLPQDVIIEVPVATTNTVNKNDIVFISGFELINGGSNITVNDISIPYGITFENLSWVTEPADNSIPALNIKVTSTPINATIKKLPFTMTIEDIRPVEVDVVMKRDVYVDPVTCETKFRYSIEDKNE